MSALAPSWELRASPVRQEPKNWYALLTRARHEKIVARRLQIGGVTTFLPLVTEVRHWSDRKKTVELPLFSCYVFAKLSPSREEQLRGLKVDGVLGLVGTRSEGIAIPEDQIAAVQAVIRERLHWRSHPFLKTGQRVCIRSGALRGVEGILIARKGESALVLSIDAIQRSLSVRIEGYEAIPV